MSALSIICFIVSLMCLIWCIGEKVKKRYHLLFLIILISSLWMGIHVHENSTTETKEEIIPSGIRKITNDVSIETSVPLKLIIKTYIPKWSYTSSEEFIIQGIR